MNRSISTTILISPWMDATAFGDVIAATGLEYSIGVNPQLKTRVLWVPNFKAEFFAIVPAGEPLAILNNLSLWYDNGVNEVHITVSNYKDYNSSLYYDNRTGKYDPIDEI